MVLWLIGVFFISTSKITDFSVFATMCPGVDFLFLVLFLSFQSCVGPPACEGFSFYQFWKITIAWCIFCYILLKYCLEITPTSSTSTDPCPPPFHHCCAPSGTSLSLCSSLPACSLVGANRLFNAPTEFLIPNIVCAYCRYDDDGDDVDD